MPCQPHCPALLQVPAMTVQKPDSASFPPVLFSLTEIKLLPFLCTNLAQNVLQAGVVLHTYSGHSNSLSFSFLDIGLVVENHHWDLLFCVSQLPIRPPDFCLALHMHVAFCLRLFVNPKYSVCIGFCLLFLGPFQ